MTDNSLFTNFVAFLRSVKDDLSNVTSPPSFLAPQSVVETSACWAERPSLFVAPTLETSPERRCLAVLKWIIASHRRQLYISEDISVGIRKPLDSFLGEIYMDQWTDETATTRVVAEQVSHQPAVTACYLSSDEHGVWGDGFSRIEMSFDGTLVVRQTGYAMLHLDRHGEHYLIQLPDIEIKGFLAGRLYPEIRGTCQIISTSGVMATTTYSGEGWLSGVKNGFEAKVFWRHDSAAKPLYTMAGCWSEGFSIHDARRGELVGEWSHEQHAAASPAQLDLAWDRRDQWESAHAWHYVKAALVRRDLPRAMATKLLFERAQRALRAADPGYDAHWEPLFFTAASQPDALLESLASAVDGWSLDTARTKGLWRYDAAKAKLATAPFHGGKGPDRLLADVAREDQKAFYDIYDVDEGTLRPLNSICESELPQEQRDYLRQRRMRKLEVRA